MKKILILGVALLMIVSAAACGGENETSKETSAISKVAESKADGGEVSTGVAWKDFVNEYTILVDKLVDIIEKAKDNPTGLEANAEYQAVLAEAQAFATEEKIADVQKSISDPVIKQEFENACNAQSLRISQAVISIFVP
jgi:hypothetical protein